MREIDTEAPVVWPAWCYSANSQESGIDLISRKGELSSEALPQTSISPASHIGVNNTGATAIAAYSSSSSKIRSKRKALYTTSLTSPTGSISPQTGDDTSKLHYKQQQQQLTSLLIKNSSSTEKMLSDRILMGFNAAENNKKNCDISATLLYDKIKNESQMDSLKNGDLRNNNNNSVNNSSCTSNMNGSNSNSNNNNNSSSNSNNNNNSNNSIKRERLSPAANGDVQSSISRSRSATPSSFPGTPPQSVHPSEMVSQNLAANLLSSVQTRTSEFQARNYSDFMRSLAAKYNNTNPNDAVAQRSLFFDQKFPSSKSSSKESPSPPESKRHQQLANISSQVSNVPFVSSLLSSLPFSPAVFPPLIDMSSTQALVTLARAAKEVEIQNILRTAQKRSSPAQTLSSLRSALAPTLSQSSATFPTQPFIVPTQFAPQSRRPQSPANDPNMVLNEAITTSPLDLSSTPQSKRLKVETESPSVSPKGESTNYKSETVPGGVGPTTSSAPAGSASSTTVSTTTRHCQAQSEEISSWSVDQVCDFVGSIDICSEYVQNFRDQCIDGSGLPLLTEDHLTNSLGMKLGPALKLRSILAKKLGGPCPCVSCTTQTHIASATSSSSLATTSSSTSGSQGSSVPNTSASNTANVSQSLSYNIPRPASADSGS